MSAMEDFSDWLSTVTTPNSKLRGAGYSGIVSGMEKAANKMTLPQAYRQSMGRNDAGTDAVNAAIGATTPQKLDFHNDWAQRDFGNMGTTASNIGLAAATPKVANLQEALGLGIPPEDIDLTKVMGSGTAPFSIIKALGSGVPLEDIDWGKLAVTDPVVGISSALAGPMVQGLTGSRIAGDATGAAATTGLAAAQGFANPLSDIAALMSYFKLFRGMF